MHAAHTHLRALSLCITCTACTQELNLHSIVPVCSHWPALKAAFTITWTAALKLVRDMHNCTASARKKQIYKGSSQACTQYAQHVMLASVSLALQTVLKICAQIAALKPVLAQPGLKICTCRACSVLKIFTSRAGSLKQFHLESRLSNFFTQRACS